MTEAAWQKWWVRLGIIGLFIFAVYSNISLLIQNNSINNQVSQEQSQVDQIKNYNQQLSLLISYYQSPSYQDVEARRRLGLKAKDETAFVVKGVTFPDTSPDTQITIATVAPTSASQAANESNFSKWLDYLAGKK